jgi:hypothetical protein
VKKIQNNFQCSIEFGGLESGTRRQSYQRQEGWRRCRCFCVTLSGFYDVKKIAVLTNMLKKEVHKSQYILYLPTLCFVRNRFGIVMMFCANLLWVPAERPIADLFSIPIKAEASHLNFS